MIKTFHVAWREFCATVLTRAFMLGIFLPPVLIGAVLTLMPALMNQKPPKTEGRIAVIDRTGQVAPRLAEELKPEKMGERRRRASEQAQAKMKEVAPGVVGDAQLKAAAAQMERTVRLTVEPLDAATDPEKAKAEMPKSRRRDQLGGDPRLALVVIPLAAVTPEPPKDAGAKPAFAEFELFSAPALDVEVKEEIDRAVSRAVVDARLAAGGLDPARVRALIEQPRSKEVTVTEQGERSTNNAAAMLVPGAFLLLTWISVFTAGQYLLTSTIEEKSNRVMEVLLSAASPMQLMVGKIVGQMAVGAVILLVYAGLGMAGLVTFALMDLIDPMHIVYLVVYFLIAFAMIACLMAAVGSAVSDIREAQSLIGPIMIVLVIPMMLWFPILRNPNSTFAQVCSFLPPISPFIMILRIPGSEPVPAWQIPASMAAGVLYAVLMAWGASKVFRIGVLMYGKPPNLGTLIKWIRMA